MLKQDYILPENCYHEIYWDNTPEFERVRSICLQEKNNWLVDNYTEKNMDLADQRGYSVVYSKFDDSPIMMSGVMASGLWPQHVARTLNRLWVFPEYRQPTVSGIVQLNKTARIHMTEPLMEVNNYKLYFVSMQSRTGKSEKNWWKWAKHAFHAANDGWKDSDLMIRVIDKPVKKAYQNFFYYEVEAGYFDTWENKPLISREDWSELPDGK